ncbi:MAG: hypothetical protein ABIR24_03300, partial [Verrucomicrobiota bacterium]
ERTRNSIIIEAIRRGIRSVDAHLLYSTPSEGIPPEMSQHMLDMNPDAEPLMREVRAAKIAKGKLEIQLDDLRRHCPGVQHRLDLMEKLAAFRRKGGINYSLLQANLSNEYMEWEISMHERFGSDSSSWPKEEITKRDTAVAKKVKMNLPPPLEVRGKKRPKPKNKNTL